jgi:predicted nucleic acid-binding protein
VSSDRAVLNASPIITLCKSGQEDLLPQLFTEVVLPGAVWEEVEVGDITDPTVEKLGALTWLKRDDTVAVASLVQAWDLGAGETAVLSYALARPDYVAVIDDSAARRCASSLNITVIGTVGLIVLAKRRGLIAQITPGLEALRDAGLWLSDKLIEQLKQQENE